MVSLFVPEPCVRTRKPYTQNPNPNQGNLSGPWRQARGHLPEALPSHALGQSITTRALGQSKRNEQALGQSKITRALGQSKRESCRKDRAKQHKLWDRAREKAAEALGQSKNNKTVKSQRKRKLWDRAKQHKLWDRATQSKALHGTERILKEKVWDRSHSKSSGTEQKKQLCTSGRSKNTAVHKSAEGYASSKPSAFWPQNGE